MSYFTLAIVAAAVSGLVQFIKTALDTHKLLTVFVLIGISFVVSGLYYAFHTTPYWPIFLKIVVTANAVYGILIHPFEPAQPSLN